LYNRAALSLEEALETELCPSNVSRNRALSLEELEALRIDKIARFVYV